MWISCLGRSPQPLPANRRSRRWYDAPPFFHARAPSWCRAPRTATACRGGNIRTRGARRGQDSAVTRGPGGPLNRRLFIHAKYGRVLRRIQIPSNYIGGLGLEVGIIAGQVALQPMRLQAGFAPHAVHHVLTDLNRPTACGDSNASIRLSVFAAWRQGSSRAVQVSAPPPAVPDDRCPGLPVRPPRTLVSTARWSARWSAAAL